MSNDEMLPEGYALLVNQIQSITKALNDDDQISVFTETDILINTLSKENIKKYNIEKLQKQVAEYLIKPEKNRLLRIARLIKLDPETAVPYYDKDIGNDPMLHYRQSEEEELLKINQQIRIFISKIIRDKLSDNFNF